MRNDLILKKLVTMNMSEGGENMLLVRESIQVSYI